MAGPGLLAHVLTAKFCDHLPLYRQSAIYAREGVDLDRSTLAKWVGESSALLAPLVEVLRRYVISADKLHGGDRGPHGQFFVRGVATRQFQCSLRGPARPRPAGSGLTFATTAPLVLSTLPPSGSPTRRTARESIRSATCNTIAASFRPTPTPVMLRARLCCEMEIRASRHAGWAANRTHNFLPGFKAPLGTPSAWCRCATASSAFLLRSRSGRVPSP